MASVGSGALLGIGNPILDISAEVPGSLMEKYGLSFGNAILAEAQHKPLFEELVEQYSPLYVGGGATQNSIRYAQWMLGGTGNKGNTSYIGCVGKDEFGRQLRENVAADGVAVHYLEDPKTPTGTCAVLVDPNSGERSLVADLNAANNYEKSHLDSAPVQEVVKAASVVYSAGFFLTVSPPSLMSIAEHVLAEGKTLAMNLSAPFICEFFGEPLGAALEYCGLLFGNETEAAAFAKTKGWDASDLKEVARKAATEISRKFEGERTVIFTQGSDATIVAVGGSVTTYAVKALPKEALVDTNGAGDAFVGGYLSQLLLGNDVASCVNAGHYCASVCIQRGGCTFPENVSYSYYTSITMTEDHKVADLSLADFGRKEIEIAEREMPGLIASRNEYGPQDAMKGARVVGSLHMTVQTAVLIETLQDLGADLRWCSCNIFSTQDHAAAAIAVGRGDGPSAAVFAWKGETLEEYWECTLNAITWPSDDGKGNGPDVIVDDGGDITLLIHEGVKAEKAFEKDGTVPDPSSTDNAEFKCVLAILARCLKEDGNRWRRAAARLVGVSEETTTGVHRLYQMEKEGTLLFPAINVNDSVTKSKFDNVYGCRHSLPDGIMRATDVMLAGKRVLICGYGDVGKGSAQAMKAAGAVTMVAEIDPICALQAAMEGFRVVRMETVVGEIDVVITTTGNKDIIRVEHMRAMKNNCIVGNIGHFDNEIQMAELSQETTRMNIKPQVDKFTFEDGHGVIVLAEGRLLNLGCATGHPSFVMSNSFTNQTLAQVELWRERETGKYATKVYVLPKHLDEKVARLHLDQLGVELTTLSTDQAEYIGVKVEGPFKPETYRY